MLAGVYNIHCDQGSTLRRVITVTQPTASGDLPVDLTGYTAAMTVRRKIGGTALISLTDDDGITLGGEEGTITIEISAEDTADIERSGIYDLELHAPGGDTYKILRGAFVLRHEVTT